MDKYIKISLTVLFISFAMAFLRGVDKKPTEPKPHPVYGLPEQKRLPLSLVVRIFAAIIVGFIAGGLLASLR